MSYRNVKFIIIIMLLIPIFYSIINNYVLAYNKERVYNEEVRTYEQEAIKYLENKYNEKFDIQFVSKGFMDYKFNFDSINSSCGHDESVEEYIYKFSPQNNDNIICEIRVRYDVQYNKINIYENDENYESAKNYYKEKMDIKQNLETLLQPYSYYEIDWYSDVSTIKVRTNRFLKDVILENIDEFKNLYYNIANLLEDRKLLIDFEYENDNSFVNYSIGGKGINIIQNNLKINDEGLLDCIYIENIEEIIKNETSTSYNE